MTILFEIASNVDHRSIPTHGLAEIPQKYAVSVLEAMGTAESMLKNQPRFEGLRSLSHVDYSVTYLNLDGREDLEPWLSQASAGTYVILPDDCPFLEEDKTAVTVESGLDSININSTDVFWGAESSEGVYFESPMFNREFFETIANEQAPVDLGLFEGVLHKEVSFTVTGTFLLNALLEPIHAHDGAISGYKLPDGRQVQLLVALEVDERQVVTSELQMDQLGFCCLDYDRTDFAE